MTRFPAPVIDELPASVAVPFKLKVAPPAAVKLPVLSVSVRISVPLLACTEPVLAHGRVSVVVPVPAVLRSAPALANHGLPLVTLNALPSAVKSSVAADELLNSAVL